MDKNSKLRIWFPEKKFMGITASIEKLLFEDGHYYDFNGATQPFEIMFPTGLKDRAGVEIYEGDILRVINAAEKGWAWLVKEIDFKWQIIKLPWDRENEPADNYDLCQVGECEILGNIHENGELLKEIENGS